MKTLPEVREKPNQTEVQCGKKHKRDLSWFFSVALGQFCDSI
jgi:hypothetical protein